MRRVEGRRKLLSSGLDLSVWKLQLRCARNTMLTSLEWRKFLCINILLSIADCRERVLGEKVGQILQKMHEDKGIKFHMNGSVESAEPSSSLSSHVGSIKLKDGKSIPADVVIMAVGVGPATEFLKESAGFKLEKDGSLTVDKHMRVKGVEDVYATGMMSVV